VVIRFYYSHLLEDTSTFRDLLFINLLFLTKLLRLKNMKRYAGIRNFMRLDQHRQICNNFLKKIHFAIMRPT